MGRLLGLARSLLEADDFIGVATRTCELVVARYDATTVFVALFGSSGQPTFVVDNASSDRCRLASLALWAAPDLAAMHLHHRPIDLVADGACIFVVPLLEPDGVVGGIAYAAREPLQADARAELTMFAAHISVRLAQLGIRRSALPLDLTPRQGDVAQLVVKGQTNAEIAAQLAMSENTVKKHLKDIFERTGVSNRAELATVFAHSAPREPVPYGTTRRGGVTISRLR